MVAWTHSDHGTMRTAYVFAYSRREQPPTKQVSFRRHLVSRATVCVLNWRTGIAQYQSARQRFDFRLEPGATAYYVVVPIEPSGLAFFGDAGKYVSNGRQRITALDETPGGLTVTVTFAAGEKSVRFFGNSPRAPKITALTVRSARPATTPRTGGSAWKCLPRRQSFPAGIRHKPPSSKSQANNACHQFATHHFFSHPIQKMMDSTCLLRVSIAVLFLGPVALPVTRADDFKPEPGYVSLFNGTDLTGWGYRTNNFDGKTASDDGRYSAGDGILTVHPRTPRKIQVIWTSREFSNDFNLKLEFRAATNADSGIFIRRPQLQCRDYLVAGPYTNLVNYRPQDWNQIDITVSNGVAHCTCNGEVLENALKVPASGPIGLEGDRGQMEYRRIRLKVSP